MKLKFRRRISLFDTILLLAPRTSRDDVFRERNRNRLAASDAGDGTLADALACGVAVDVGHDDGVVLSDRLSCARESGHSSLVQPRNLD